MKDLIVSLHDVAPSKAELCRRWIDILNSRGIRSTLLVVPGIWNAKSLESSPSFVSWLRQVHEQGHEVALHGYMHVNDFHGESHFGRRIVGRLLARGCEEFWHLSREEAFTKISNGREILEKNGFSPTGFVAPGWLMSPGTCDALRDHNFNYTVTHTHLVDLKGGQKLFIPTVSQRPQSVVAKPSALLNQGVVRLFQSGHHPVRIAVHPNDGVNPRLRQSNISMIDSLIGNGYRSVTYEEKWSAHANGSRHYQVKPQR